MSEAWVGVVGALVGGLLSVGGSAVFDRLGRRRRREALARMMLDRVQVLLNELQGQQLVGIGGTPSASTGGLVDFWAAHELDLASLPGEDWVLVRDAVQSTRTDIRAGDPLADRLLVARVKMLESAAAALARHAKVPLRDADVRSQLQQLFQEEELRRQGGPPAGS